MRSKQQQRPRQLHSPAEPACHACGCVRNSTCSFDHLHTHKPPTLLLRRYKLNIWDVGGQKTLRPYWRNYYEKTDGLIWVVDAADLARLEDCKKELHSLLQEERLFGATLLILANKQDIPSALSLEEIAKVRTLSSPSALEKMAKVQAICRGAAAAGGLQRPQGMASGQLGVREDKQVGSRRACARKPLVAEAAAAAA